MLAGNLSGAKMYFGMGVVRTAKRRLEGMGWGMEVFIPS